jgi:hypothetical protein
MGILYFAIPAVFLQFAPCHIIIELNFGVDFKFDVLVDLCGKLTHRLLRVILAGKRMDIVGLAVFHFLCIYAKYSHYSAHIFAEALMIFIINFHLSQIIHITAGKMSKK